MLKVAFIDYHYDPQFASAQALFQTYRTSLRLASAVAKLGNEVCLFQRAAWTEEIELQGVRVVCISDGFGPLPRLWQTPRALHRAVCGFRPDVIHIHGLSYPIQVRALSKQTTGKICLQDHAERPLPGWKKTLQKFCFKGVSSYLFAAKPLAKVWLEAGIIANPDLVHEIMEGANDLPILAPSTTRLGKPGLIWVGRLNHNKDPLTVVEGFAQFLDHSPEARLLMIFQGGELEAAVRSRVTHDPFLAERVQLEPDVAHSDLPGYYASADCFVLGSHSEGSGYALMEALAQGLYPVVTDIPSFRRLTDQGRIGMLWQPGQPTRLAHSLANLPTWDRAAVSAYYQKHLSMEAIAEALLSLYAKISGN